jgi:two-component system CheB/CheR fusion protein
LKTDHNNPPFSGKSDPAPPAGTAGDHEALEPISITDQELHTLFAILQTRTSHDFSSYKKNTVLRRIERRIAVNAAGEFSNYLEVLKEIPQEAHALCQELLIGVTSFFRDPEAFELLRGKIIPALFANRNAEEPVRIWHASCATGEEAYSVAMLILEHLAKENLRAKVQIFATDLDEAAVARARAGLYSDDITAAVSEQRLRHFFTRSEGCWKVTKQLREMIVFAPHNIIKDPPFSRLDLLVCRNFLIYLNPDIQKLLIPLFHQVLNPGGFLFLGSAETVGTHIELFTPVDKKWKIFMRQGGKSRVDTLFPFSGPVRTLVDLGRSVRTSEAEETATVDLANKLLMDRYVPARVIINEKNEVVHFSHRAGAYLLTPEGKPTRDLLKIAREGLRPALRAAIYKAFTNQQETEYRGIKMVTDRGEKTINIIVIPLKEHPPSGRLALVIIEPASSADHPAPGEELCGGDDTSSNSLIRHLEEQLRVAGEQLQYTSEELETSYERYMLANEELMTVNEELQSTNEELQSTNEELVTVNSELQKKMDELNQSNSDLENLFTSSEIATFFLDRELLIKRFSPAMAAIFDLIPADIGRPVRHLNNAFDLSTLPLDAISVLKTLVPIEREISSRDDRSFIMRVLPYKTTEGLTDGIVVTLVDISERIRHEEALRRSKWRYHTLFDTLIEGFCTIEIVFDSEGRPVDYRFLEVNPAFAKQTGLHDAQGRFMRDLAPDHERHWFEIYGKVALTGEPVQFEKEAKALGRYYDVCAYRIGEPESRQVAILFNDITERKRAEETLILSEQRRSLALEAVQAGTWEWDLRTNEYFWSDELWSLYGLEPYSCKPSHEEWRKIVHPGDRSNAEHIIGEAISQGRGFNTEWRIMSGEGTERWLLSRGRPITDNNDHVVRYLGIVIDITERKRVEEEKKTLQSQLIQAQKMEAIGTLAGGIAHDFNNILGAVIGYSELAREASPPGSELAGDLDKVLEAGKRAADLVKQILAFSRQAGSNERILLEPVHLVKEAIKLLRPALPSTITIKQRLDGVTRPILADPTQIHQIVMNLCTNAFHAMEKTGGILEIALRNCELTSQNLSLQSGLEAGEFVVLSIGDTGPGIRPAIRDKIFEPYFTTKEVGKGTGMGLSIVHGIVITMGGFITCESELGEGTIFKVYFPAIKREVASVDAPVETVFTGRERILFVDDEEILAKMGKVMLERLGYQVTVYASSVEALATFRNHPDRFDAVITDQTMPDMTGLDLAKRMLLHRPDMPIILCTGYSNLVNEEQAKANGIKGFIMKPMSMKDIAQLLRRVLDDGIPPGVPC